MKVVGYVLMILSLVFGALVDSNILPVKTEIGVSTSFVAFLLSIYILCVTKNK